MKSKFYSYYGGEFRSDWRWDFVIPDGKYTTTYTYDGYAGSVKHNRGKYRYVGDHQVDEKHREELQRLLIKGILDWGWK